MKAIAYQNFIVIAIKAIQEQQKEIEELKEKNNLIMEEIGKLKAAKCLRFHHTFSGNKQTAHEEDVQIGTTVCLRRTNSVKKLLFIM